MNKIPVSELEFKGGKVYRNDIEISLEGKEILSDYFTFNIPRLKGVQNRVRDFKPEMTFSDFNQIIMCNCLSKMYSTNIRNVDIIFDSTFVEQVEETLNVDYYHYVNQLCDINMKDYNSNDLKFDISRLTKKKLENELTEFYIKCKGSDKLCITENDETTPFFRDLMFIESLFANVIMVDLESNTKNVWDLESLSNNVIPFFVKNIKLPGSDSCFNHIINDVQETYNTLLLKQLTDSELLLEHIPRFCKDLNSKEYDSFNNTYYELVLIKSREMIDPSFLLKEVAVSGDKRILKCGLKKLGFMS